MDTQVREWRQKIAEANKDFEKQITQNLVDFQYDLEEDVLYVALGQTAEAFSLPVGDHPEDDVYLRVNRDTFRIVGFDIIGFKAAFLPRHEDARAVFAPIFALFGDDIDWRIQFRAPGTKDQQILLLMPAAQARAYFPKFLRKAEPQLVPA